MAKGKVSDHLGSEHSEKKKPSKHHVHEIRVVRADGGGHHIYRHMRDDQGNDAGVQTAVAPDNDAMGQQVQDAMADQPAAGEGQPPQPAAQPGMDQAQGQ
jgi:hypothetical protein